MHCIFLKYFHTQCVKKNMLDSVGGKVVASMGKKMEKSQTELTKRQASALMPRKLGRDKRVPNCTVLTHPSPNYIINYKHCLHINSGHMVRTKAELSHYAYKPKRPGPALTKPITHYRRKQYI
jgi:malate synthase